jgi:hypothetical protein
MGHDTPGRIISLGLGIKARFVSRVGFQIKNRFKFSFSHRHRP